MELKKNPALELSKMRGLFFSIGLSASLGMIVGAFEYKASGSGEIVDLGDVRADFEEVMEIPPTEQPPPPPATVVQMANFIEVPDEEEIEEEINVELDVEITEEMIIPDIDYSEVPEEKVDEIFTIVEKKPFFPGGDVALFQFFADNINYPSGARRMGIEGRVFVQFVISKDGSITDVMAIKGIGSGCDEEAERVITMMPAWSPGKQRGKPVKVRMVLPVFFQLRK